MVHAQFLPTDRMEKVKQLGIIPSFFSAHAYYWGDVHLQNLGEERAKNLSPDILPNFAVFRLQFTETLPYLTKMSWIAFISPSTVRQNQAQCSERASA